MLMPSYFDRFLDPIITAGTSLVLLFRADMTSCVRWVPGPPPHLPFLILRRVALLQAKTAWELKKVWPELELHIVPDAGHSARELGTSKMLVEVGNNPTYFPARNLRLPQAADKFVDLK